MSFSTDPLDTLDDSLTSIDILLQFAGTDPATSNDTQRNLFLKLSVVLLVTRLQVFVESLMKEFREHLADCNLKYENLPIYAKLTSIRILVSELSLEKKLQNTEAYNEGRYQEVQAALTHLNSHFSSDAVEKNLNFKTAFPLGKTGSKELVDLFRQFEGKDVFSDSSIDLGVLDALLLTRHLIIHHDISKDLTEKLIKDYRQFIKDLAAFCSTYLEALLQIVGTRT